MLFESLQTFKFVLMKHRSIISIYFFIPTGRRAEACVSASDCPTDTCHNGTGTVKCEVHHNGDGKCHCDHNTARDMGKATFES